MLHLPPRIQEPQRSEWALGRPQRTQGTKNTTINIPVYKESRCSLTGDLLHDPLDGRLGEGGPAEHLVPVELPLREVGDEHLHPLTLLPLLVQAPPLLLLTALLLRQGLLKRRGIQGILQKSVIYLIFTKDY